MSEILMGSWICNGHSDSQMYCWLVSLPHHCPTPNPWLVDSSYPCIRLRTSAETSVVLLFPMNNIPNAWPGPECLRPLLLLRPSRFLSSPLCSWQTEPQWFPDLLALIPLLILLSAWKYHLSSHQILNDQNRATFQSPTHKTSLESHMKKPPFLFNLW